MRKFAIALAASITSLAGAGAQENYESWPLLQNPFESTGGGGIMIGGYEPVVTGARCVTHFTATEPNGAVHHNMVAFDAVPAQGGVLCTNGAWRARGGSVSGTTPLRVFIKNGVTRRSP